MNGQGKGFERVVEPSRSKQKQKKNFVDYPRDRTLAAGHQFPLLNTDLTKFDPVVLLKSIDVTDKVPIIDIVMLLLQCTSKQNY